MGCAEGRFIFTLQALGTLAVYLISTAAVTGMYALSHTAHLVVMCGAALLLLPLLLIPTGSGGLLSQKADVAYHQLSNYEDVVAEEEEEAGEQRQQGRAQAAGTLQDAADGQAADKTDLRQPLLGPPPVSMDRTLTAQHSMQRTASMAGGAAALAPQLSPWQCLQTASFWMLFTVLVIGLGSGGATCCVQS